MLGDVGSRPAPGPCMLDQEPNLRPHLLCRRSGSLGSAARLRALGQLPCSLLFSLSLSLGSNWLIDWCLCRGSQIHHAFLTVTRFTATSLVGSPGLLELKFVEHHACIHMFGNGVTVSSSAGLLLACDNVEA